MNNIQSKLLYILKNFISICNNIDLRWFADGGTLLGAVRHEGFIPWDDDIDIAMPREDFDILTNAMHKYSYAKDLFWQDPITDPEYFNIHARLRLDGTTAISERELGLNSHKGMFIDIYPIDEVPDDVVNVRGFLYNIRNFAELSHDKEINACSYKLMQLLLRRQHGKNVGALCFSAYKKYQNVKVSCDAYDAYHEYKFEDISVRVPIGYEEILNLWYGKDWRTPREEASFHSIFIDSMHDYHEYDSAKTMTDLIEINQRLLSN